MAPSLLFISLGRLRLTLSAPFGQNPITGRLAGNNFDCGWRYGAPAVAERLSENPSVSIAVVEAGGFYEIENGNISQVPGYDINYAYPSGGTPPLVDWAFTTEAQKGYNNRKTYYPQGKTLGGSSALNFMAYDRATVGTFKWWADTVGDDGWLWDTVFSFYKKSPQFTAPNLQKIGPGFDLPYDTSAFSPQGGPLQVSFANYQQPVSPFLAKGMKSAGIKEQNGFNSGVLNGYATTTVCVNPKWELRSSSEASFLQTAFMNTGLKVYQRTTAEKIFFDAMKKTTGGETYTLSANKEIIVSSGAFHSPQLLMVSGIGPAATLEANNIPAVSTLEGVGQNLRDQVYFLIVQKTNATSNSQLLNNPAFAAEAAQSYLKDQTAPLASISGDLAGWEKVPEPNRNQLSPQLPPNWQNSPQTGLRSNAFP